MSTNRTPSRAPVFGLSVERQAVERTLFGDSEAARVVKSGRYSKVGRPLIATILYLVGLCGFDSDDEGRSAQFDSRAFWKECKCLSSLAVGFSSRFLPFSP